MRSIVLRAGGISGSPPSMPGALRCSGKPPSEERPSEKTETEEMPPPSAHSILSGLSSTPRLSVPLWPATCTPMTGIACGSSLEVLVKWAKTGEPEFPLRVCRLYSKFS